MLFDDDHFEKKPLENIKTIFWECLLVSLSVMQNFKVVVPLFNVQCSI